MNQSEQSNQCAILCVVKSKYLYIPIETKNREFDAKLFFASVAAERGYEVVLGNQKIFLRSLPLMPRGIYVDKSAAAEKIGRYVTYQRLGFKLVAYDEEGLVPWNLSEYQRSRQFSDNVLSNLEYFFAWGQRQADFITETLVNEKQKILAVGHPRGDLTRKELRGFYDDKARMLQERYGRFILINTNFALCNHFYGEHGLIHIKHIEDAELRDFYMRVGEHQQKLFDYFVELIQKLRQEFPEISVVVRPHPSENHAYWQSLFVHDKNVYVVHEDNVYSWLMAAEVIIHNSCTTGLEAYLLERPVIAYRPIQNPAVENELPNLLSDQQLRCDDVIASVRAYLFQQPKKLPEKDFQKEKAIAHYMTALDGRFSSERIMDAIDLIQLSTVTPEILLRRWYVFLKSWGRRCYQTLILGKTSASEDHAQQYRAQKFPGISLEEVEQSLQKFRTLTGRFSFMQATQIEKDLFRIRNYSQR